MVSHDQNDITKLATHVYEVVRGDVVECFLDKVEKGKVLDVINADLGVVIVLEYKGQVLKVHHEKHIALSKGDLVEISFRGFQPSIND